MNSMVLLLAMSAGQPPATPGETPAYTYPGLPPLARGAAPDTLTGLVYLPSAQPAPMPQPPGQPPATNGNGNGNGEEKKDEEKKDEPPPPPVYLLERSLRETWLGKTMADRGIKMYGWTAMNYSNSTTSTTNLPMTFNDFPNHYQMNQNWIHLEKTIDTSKSEFQWGWNLDGIVPGTDARFTLARGLFNGQHGEYQFDLYQFYTQAFLPNLGEKGTTIKVGRFMTHCNYEVVQAVDTPFVSKSYLFQYNPFTHTGVWALTQLNDTWSIGNGAALGSDNFIDSANRLTYLGQITWAPPEGKTSAQLNAVVTNPKFDVAENFAFYNFYEARITHKFTDKFTYIFTGTYSHMNNVPNIGTANWYGGANYFLYKFTDKLLGTLRAEVFEDTSGVRTGFKGLYTEATLGVAWTPIPDVIVRPSVRYDYNGNSRPFDGDHSMWSAAFEMIFRW
jgi:hypothetical protein